MTHEQAAFFMLLAIVLGVDLLVSWQDRREAARKRRRRP